MLISHTHRFIYIHVGKTGGMSVREVLKPYSQEPEKFRIRRPQKMRGDSPNPFYTVWETMLLHAKIRDIQKELPPDVFANYYKFAFVRNPWDLMVSMYHFILREPEAAKHDEVRSLSGFDAFIHWVARTPDPFPRGVPRLQKDMLTDSEGRLAPDFIGRFETLDRDFAQVCGVLQIENTLPHLNQSRHRDYRTYYNEETRALIAEQFQPDIDLFGYTFGGDREAASSNAIL